MIIDEEPKIAGEINPDALEGVFEEVEIDEEVVMFTSSADDEDGDELDIPFTDDEGDW